MDATIKKLPIRPQVEIARGPSIARPSREEAEEAVRTLIAYAGDDPAREGLRETPKRVISAYDEFFAGYHECPLDVLSRTFDEVAGYDDIVMLRDIELHSHCEHHMIPFVGKAHVAYFPTDRVVGISKLARVVQAYAKRFQIQERMTSEIAAAVQMALKPQGVGVIIKANHHCMSSRGVQKVGSDMVTSCMLGCFRDNPISRQEFVAMVED